MARFVGIPTIPPQPDMTLSRVLVTMKENIELLTGQRGELDGASAALTAGQITATPVSPTFTALTAKASGVTIEGVPVPLLSDYAKALADLQSLAVDVNTLRNTVNTLIAQLRSLT